MCDEMIIFFVLNSFTIVYAASRYGKAGFVHFWCSFAVFSAMGMLFYYQVTSDCPVVYTKVAAGFLAVDLIVLIIDSKPWLAYLFNE